MEFATITVVDSRDFPPEVLDYCVEQEISTHYQNDIIQLEDDGNPLMEWLKSQGYVFQHMHKSPSGDWDDIGIYAT